MVRFIIDFFSTNKNGAVFNGFSASAASNIVQRESPVKEVPTFLQVEVAEALTILTFKIINKGRKVAQVSIILTFKKAGKVERCLSPSALFTEHQTSFS